MSHNAIIHTSKWPIYLILHADKTPYTVANFVTLAQEGFYDGLNFHRVIEDFMVQAGCPQGTGTGGPWYAFADEFHQELRHTWPGILSMANSWPNSNGSQFFITHVETPWLDGKHAVFWRVVSADDQEVVNNIRQWDLIERVEILIDTISLPEGAQDFANQIKEARKAMKN